MNSRSRQRAPHSAPGLIPGAIEARDSSSLEQCGRSPPRQVNCAFATRPQVSHCRSCSDAGSLPQHCRTYHPRPTFQLRSSIYKTSGRRHPYQKQLARHLDLNFFHIRLSTRMSTPTSRLSPAQRALLDEATRDRDDVSISDPGSTLDALDFGVIDRTVAAAGVEKDFTIKVIDPSSVITIVDVRWSRAQLRPFVVELDDYCTLHHGDEYRITIQFQQSEIGRYSDQLEFEFSSETPIAGNRFIILRPITVVVGSPVDYDLLRPQISYVPPSRGTGPLQGQIVEGVPPPRPRAVHWRGGLPKSHIPESLDTIFSAPSGKITVKSVKEALSLDDKPISTQSYTSHFKAMLWLEEWCKQRDLEVFDIEEAQVKKRGVYHYLKVPGLAEKRPSVLIGDRILVQQQGSTDGKIYEGHVHLIFEKKVVLQFDKSFVALPKERYHVRFRLDRTPLQRQHQSLTTLFNAQHIFFPLQRDVGSLTSKKGISIAKHFQDNQPQLKAIKAIVLRAPGTAPFILFGPPGTGKTVTGIESIRQILHRNPKARILACAPSNAAADIIASRLVDLGPEVLFRFYAPSRETTVVPAELLPFTFINDKRVFSHPPLKTVRRYRVIVSTCMSAAFAAGIGLKRGHFTHIFVDEAGQATEPEVMVAIKGMADARTNIVLLGDPKQLAPVVHSTVARQMGLDVSFMERLMARDIYKADKSNGIAFVKLVKNYRSHEAILRYPNQQFYDAELETCGELHSIDSFLESPVLASSRFPVVFHATVGKDAREGSSPSFFNVEEVLQVKAYVEEILSDTQFPIEAKEIGIIAPYQAQCKKIRLTLDNIAGGQDIKVGSVEEFQGQERRVIIVSTVRSSQDLISFDVKHTLGFVAHPRRFNVAVTRAKALLVVIGDPTVLSLDPIWRGFLNYVHSEGGWKGVPISWDPTEPVRADGGYDAELRDVGRAILDELTGRMEKLGAAAEDVSAVAQDVDAEEIPWWERE
ncbi:P-loop containing nucleoside triphosphate hydrolase protein [Artomyces pyxidatus]|uniref:P-loop containing nucleoside triphosphate hydrolase protein n=1 Tax=Artomyces pyxidatus TaxID=48021 RepID=A0ACB8T2Q3_9AGAM|nr:P-loop containing nucleoside triphosphate hydrolase protein [Artomyces pyxidatus]